MADRGRVSSSSVNSTLSPCRIISRRCLHNAPRLKEIATDVMAELVGRENLNITHNFGGGSTDMGNLSCLMPILHPYISGASGASHGNEFRIADDARLARKMVDTYEPLYPSKEAYFADWGEDGSVTVNL